MGAPLRALVAFAGSACVLACAGTVHAADAAEARLAQALFDEARALMEQKRFAEACPKLAESQRLDPGPGTLLNLAVCHEGEGKLATASAEYREVIAISTRENRADRRIVAEQHLKTVEPLVPKLAVSVAPRVQALPGLEIRVDGLELRQAAWGVAAPVDPGAHVIQASATGQTPWTMTVPVEKGENRRVEVDLPAPPPPVAGAWPVQPPPPVAPYPPAETTKHNPVSSVLLATTIVGYVGFAGFGIFALGEGKTAKDGCLEDRDYCFDPKAKDAASRASTYAWLSTISLGVGVGSMIALLVVPSRIPLTSSAKPLHLGVGPASLSLSGAF